MNDDLDVLTRLVAYHDHIAVPETTAADDVRRGQQRVRRARTLVTSGVALGVAAIVTTTALVVTAGDRDSAPPPIAPTPTKNDTRTTVQAPGPDDHPATLLEVDGGLVLATVDRVDRVGTATLWRKDDGGWQQVGTVAEVRPRHLTSDSDGSSLRPGPGSQDLYLTSSTGEIRFSADGGATWTTLSEPESCDSAPCYPYLYGDYAYVLGGFVDSELDLGLRPATTLSRAAFGTTTWEELNLPASGGPGPGYMQLLIMEDGTLVIEEVGGCEASAQGHYRVSRDHGETWSERRTLPGESSCLSGTDGEALYTECSTTACYYDTGGNGGGEGIYRTTDLVRWEPAQEHVPHGMRYGDPVNSWTADACPDGVGSDPVYDWVEERGVRVGDEVFKMFHVRGTQGHEHVLKVSRDDCRTWERAYP